MRKPFVTTLENGLNLTFKEEGFRVIAEHYTDGEPVELTFFFGEKQDIPPVRRRVNLLSASNVAALTRKLSEKNSGVDWDIALDYIADVVIEAGRHGEPVEEIWPIEDETLEAKYLVKPLLYLKHPTIIFGDYGSLKSMVSLVIAYVAQLPWQLNNLGLDTGEETAHCLYLDYEDDIFSFRKRWSSLARGLGQGEMGIFRRRMTAPLAESVEGLERIITANNIQLLIVDSLGPSARGNLNDPEPAIRYNIALRQLGVTSLTLAHTSKDQLTKKRTIFGSIFFTNLARSVWECKAEQEAGEDEAVISLKQTKANLSRLHPPLGYHFTFTDNSISVMKTDLRDTSLSGEMPLKWRIKNLLKQGASSIKEISEELESKEDTVGRTLRRMKSKNEVIKLDDEMWGLSLL